ncbi:MAG TPA: PepSY domain-containing protein [bacterium]|nr:PepSY domain-containing protein [bacterium]
MRSGWGVAVAVAAACWLVGCGGENAGYRGSSDGQEQRHTAADWLKQARANLACVKVPLVAVIPQAEAAVHGRVIAAQLDERTEGPVYALDVLTETMVYAVKIDAMTDSLVGIDVSKRGQARTVNSSGSQQGQDHGPGGMEPGGGPDGPPGGGPP